MFDFPSSDSCAKRSFDHHSSGHSMNNHNGFPIRPDSSLPVGVAVPGWTPPSIPSSDTMTGSYCVLERLCVDKHGKDLYEANKVDRSDDSWTYLPYGPFDSYEHYEQWLRAYETTLDPLFFAIKDSSLGRAFGVASYLRIAPIDGVVEVGHIKFSPQLQRTRAATEAMFLMMSRAFESGYRRYEWKCDSLNSASRKAAQRLGFVYEGTFRQARVYKGRNRDTAWYSIIDTEWPALREAFRRWLDTSNFDPQGLQKQSLSSLLASPHYS